MTPQIIRCIGANKPLAVLNKLITKELLRLDRAKFDADMREEYDNVYKLKEVIQKTTIFDEAIQEEVTTTEVIGFDYLDDAPTFEEYKNETIVIQEAVEATYDEDGMILTEAIPELTELVRPYIPIEVTDEMIQAELNKIPEYKEYLSKQKQDKLNNLYVTVNDKVFDAHLEARLNMATAIQASSLTNQTETQWKMYDNSVQTVTIGELQQALILALTEVGKTIGAIDGD
jgi:hypothetical protein